MKQIPTLMFYKDPAADIDGYVRFTVGSRRVAAREWAATAIFEALSGSTLHEWAASRKACEHLYGRGVSYGVSLPAGTEKLSSTAVVVRRNRHGGLFRFLTGDCFLLPTRAPLELSVSLRLAAAGVPTPEVIGYVIYPIAGIFARSDFMTRRLPDGGDFPDLWCNADASSRETMILKVAELLRSLAKGGAWHADLNLKNIYIAGHGSAMTAYLLDVDRVTFPARNDIAILNFKRLARSVRKWRDQRGLDFSEEMLARLESLAMERF